MQSSDHRPARKLLALVTAALCVLVFASMTGTVRAGAAERVVSSQGIEAWLVNEPSIPFLAVRFAFRSGARSDPPGKEGLAQLASGLLDEGAGDLDSLAFQTRLEETAIRLSFSAGRDTFGGRLQTLTENRDEAARLLSLALSQPRFDDDAVERVRRQNITSLTRNARNPNQIARKLFAATVFPDHPYGRPADGTVDGISEITRQDLLDFAARTFTRDQLVIGVAGDITAEELGAWLDSAFSALPNLDQEQDSLQTTPQAAGHIVVEEQPVPQSVVVFGHEGLMRNHPDYYAAYVMNHILGGGGFGSRLTEEIREKRGLAYGVYSYLNPLDYASLYVGGVATENSRVAESLSVIRAEWQKMRDNGVTAEELADAQTYLTGSFPLRLDSNGEVAGMLVGMQLHELGLDYIERRNSFIKAVTVEDVQRVASTLLRPENLTVVVVGAPESIESTPVR